MNRKKLLVLGILSFLILAKTNGLNYSINKNQDMATLNIDFQEGFIEDSVECQLNGNLIYERNNCTTKLLIGFADSVDVNVNEGVNKLKVVIKSRGIEKDIPIQVNDDVYIGISILNGKIEYIISDKPFGYG